MARQTVVDAQFGLRMREMRQARGLSLRALASRALSNKSQLQAFEVGKEWPTTDTARRIDEALGANGELATLVIVQDRPRATAVGLEYASDWTRAISVAADLWRGDLRHHGRARRSSFDASVFVAPAMRWLTASFDERPCGSGSRPVDEPDVETIRRATTLFRSLDNKYGGGHIRDMVVRFLDAEVAPLLRDGRFNESIGSALLSATAELTQLAGWASYDAGLQGLGQRYLIQALRLAMIAGDRPLGAEIVAAMSHQAAYLKASAEAVDLARASARIAVDAGVGAIAAEAAVLEAQGLALRGEESASAAALDRAERTLDRADRDRDPQWIRYFDEAYLSARFGHCFAALERGDLARRFAARSLDMDGRYVRGRQFNLALLAKAHVQAGEIEEAATVGVEAVEVAEGLKSARSVDYLRDLADRLAPHVGLPVVNDFVLRARPLIRFGG
jgi:transcriptional regulator with XRE-family HTH domain